MKTYSRGFTLIELLIVVAIIAILAAIAVPNFLEAQVRAKVSRARADMRSMATALEAYRVDNNGYIACNTFGTAAANPATGGDPILENLSSPIAYLSQAIIRDVFNVRERYSGGDAMTVSTSSPVPIPVGDVRRDTNSYIYQAWNSEDRVIVVNGNFLPDGANAAAWLLHSAGPDEGIHNLGGVLSNDFDIAGPLLLMYDPTNGTVSFGSIYRTGGSAPGAQPPAYAGGIGLVQAIQGAQ